MQIREWRKSSKNPIQEAVAYEAHIFYIIPRTPYLQNY